MSIERDNHLKGQICMFLTFHLSKWLSVVSQNVNSVVVFESIGTLSIQKCQKAESSESSISLSTTELRVNKNLLCSINITVLCWVQAGKCSNRLDMRNELVKLLFKSSLKLRCRRKGSGESDSFCDAFCSQLFKNIP